MSGWNQPSPVSPWTADQCPVSWRENDRYYVAKIGDPNTLLPGSHVRISHRAGGDLPSQRR
jgi:hypothetical protein